jgi:hypothetical protein
MTTEQQAIEWLATVKARALTRVRAQAVADGTQLSAAQLELVGIGVLAGAREMLTLTDQLGLRLRPSMVASSPDADI